jgi:carboxyl-terminal processing protease
MNTIHDRGFKRLLMIVALLVGAVFFYLAGAGTGLYVARVSWLAPTVTVEEGQPATTDEACEVPPGQTPVPAVKPTLVATPTPVPSGASAPSGVPDEEFFGIFWEAWDILEQGFYGELPERDELPYAAIEGVIASTGDPYTAFLDPMQAEILRTDLQGGFEGIGATVRLSVDGRLLVVQPLPGWPAIEAGLRAGDIVLEVDGEELLGMSLYEAISLIRGPAGTSVRLLVEREEVDDAFTIEITRARIELPSVESRMLEDNLGYVRLRDFGQTAGREIEKALKELDANELDGLIFDLRGNRGGYLSVAVEVTSEFVGEGPVLIERFKDGQERRYPVELGGRALDVPLVVLVDGGSASASEIAAGAIQDTGRGVLIGTTTLGKGSVQTVHDLSDGSELRVTVARWFTPNDREIHGVGLEPDIEIELTEQDILDERDPQLDRAIEYLTEGK